MKAPILKGRNFRLRPFRQSDCAFLVACLNDKAIHRYTLNIPYPYSLKDAKEWIGRQLPASDRQTDQLVWAIEVNSQVAGAIDLRGIALNHKARFGYWLAKEHWGQGIMTEAVGLVSQYASNKLRLRRLDAQVIVGNLASRRVLEKNGFKLEGLMRKQARKNGRLLDAWLLARVK